MSDYNELMNTVAEAYEMFRTRTGRVGPWVVTIANDRGETINLASVELQEGTITSSLSEEMDAMAIANSWLRKFREDGFIQW